VFYKNDIEKMNAFNSLLASESLKVSLNQLQKLGEKIESDLEYLKCTDIIDQSCITDETKMIQKKKEQYILGIQKGKIYSYTEKRGDGSTCTRFKTRPNGQKNHISATTYEGLIDKLYEYYKSKGDNDMLKDTFPKATIWKSQRGVSAKTMLEHKRIWDKYFANSTIASMEVKAITPAVLKKFYDELCVKYKLNYKQLQGIRGVISYIMKYCVNNNLIAHNPVNDIDYKDLLYAKTSGRKDKIKKTPFPVAMIPDILKWCEEELKRPRVNALHSYGIIIGIKLGDRYGELRGMRWSNINWVEHTIMIDDQSVPVYTMNDDLSFSYEGHKLVGHIKGYEEPVAIPIPPEAYEALKKIKELEIDEEFVFPENGFRHNTFNNTIKRMAKDLCLDPAKYSSHSLRATMATDLYLKTHDIFLVQRVLHHTTPEMTQKYIKDLDLDEKLRKIMLSDDQGNDDNDDNGSLVIV